MNRTITGTTTLGHSGPGSNCNERTPHRSEASSDAGK